MWMINDTYSSVFVIIEYTLYDFVVQPIFQLGSMLVTRNWVKPPNVGHSGEAYIWRLTSLVITFLKLTLKPSAYTCKPYMDFALFTAISVHSMSIIPSQQQRCNMWPIAGQCIFIYQPNLHNETLACCPEWRIWRPSDQQLCVHLFEVPSDSQWCSYRFQEILELYICKQCVPGSISTCTGVGHIFATYIDILCQLMSSVHWYTCKTLLNTSQKSAAEVKVQQSYNAIVKG